MLWMVMYYEDAAKLLGEKRVENVNWSRPAQCARKFIKSVKE